MKTLSGLKKLFTVRRARSGRRNPADLPGVRPGGKFVAVRCVQGRSGVKCSGRSATLEVPALHLDGKVRAGFRKELS
jgi:hypothetical protein